jgi:hypothetical protein
VRLWYAYRWGGQGAFQEADSSVGLEATQPRFGGLRWWFLCPLAPAGRSCGRRVGKLFLPPHQRYFGCRHCHDLTHRSCQESHKDDALARLLADDMGQDFASVKRIMKRLGKRS